MAIDRLVIPPACWSDVLRHIEACLPEEACGFLGGRAGVVRRVVPVVNAAHSPVRYRMDPEGQLQGMTDLEADGLSMTAIFHSHPGGPSGLSPTDRVEAAYPESALLVLSPSARGWQGRAFLVDGGRVVEVEVDIGPGGKG